MKKRTSHTLRRFSLSSTQSSKYCLGRWNRMARKCQCRHKKGPQRKEIHREIAEMPGNTHILKKISNPEFSHLHTLASNESCPEESHQPVIQYQQKNADSDGRNLIQLRLRMLKTKQLKPAAKK